MRINHAVILGLIIVLIASPVSAATSLDPVKYNVGESWIKVTWNSEVTTNIYVDGKLVTDDLSGMTRATNNTIGYYYLSALNSNSQHSIQLVNASDATDTKTMNIKTLAPVLIVQILFVIGLALSVFMLFTSDIVKTILLGVLTIILCLFATSISFNYYGMYYLFWGFIIWSAIMICLGIYNTFHEEISWW